MTLQLIVLALGAGFSALLLALATSRLVLANPLLIQSRLAGLGRDGAPEAPTVTGGILLGQARSGTLRLIDRGVQRFLGTGPRLQLDRAGVRLSLGDFFLMRGVAVVGGSVGALVVGWSTSVALSPVLLAGAGAATGLLVPAIYLRVRIGRRAKQTELQLVELCEVMSTMLASGFGYMQALSATADQVGKPLGEEVGRFLDAVRLGSDFDRALADTRLRVNSADFEVIATALEVQRRTGGNLSEILRGVGQTIRERQAFQQELRALTSRERFSAIIIAVFPLLLVGLLTAMLPEVFGRLFIDSTGRIVLGIALAMDTVGYLVARRLAKLEV